MLKAIRIALGMLYAAQVLMVCREPAAHVYRDFAGDGGDAGGGHQVLVDLRDMIKRAYVSLTSREEQVATLPPTTGHLTTVKGKETDHPVEKHSALVKRQRRNRGVVSYLIAHFAPLYKKRESPGADRPWRTREMNRCRHSCASQIRENVASAC